jgi:uncharacterized protein
MESKKIVLTADWIHLVMLNYAVDSSILERFVPPGTSLETFEGRTYLSMVGFEFNHSRLLGVPMLFHQAFEEVNLRFYVRRSSRRGVVFIRELVPSFAVAAVARCAFNEKFLSVPMWHRIGAQPQSSTVEAEYGWGSGPRRCSMRIETEGPSFLPAEGSLCHFISEHYWGYRTQPSGGTVEFEVQHPRWRIREAKRIEIKGNLAEFYGEEIAQALAGKPDSAFLADGSAVKVFRGKRISG